MVYGPKLAYVEGDTVTIVSHHTKSLHLVQFALDCLQPSRNLVDPSEDLYHPVFSRHVMALWDLVREVGKGRGGSVRGIQSRLF